MRGGSGFRGGRGGNRGGRGGGSGFGNKRYDWSIPPNSVIAVGTVMNACEEYIVIHNNVADKVPMFNRPIYLENKTKDLLQNVNELIFRFNIINNPWLEIIQDALENYAFLPTVLQNSLHYLQIAKKFHMWKTASDIIDFFSLSKNNQPVNL